MDKFVIGGTAFWAFLGKKNDMSDAYTIDVGRLSKGDIAKLEEVGIPVKEDKKNAKDDDNYRGHYVTCKSSKFQPRVVDSQRRVIDVKQTLVGNGSTVNVEIQPYEWKYKNKKGVAAGFTKVQVVDLVEYEADDPFEDIDDGYVAPEPDTHTDVDDLPDSAPEEDSEADEDEVIIDD